ncbi:NPC intracellular cholesterol transporter 2 homolog a-like [Nasonia vitripennis]|uniref:MD-2-related lipid-recognition domain-containing protein n=1 Tax=Nasonia vitripennis TaxID=7425 RepID=A0A7M7G261_NASVI|nr:NPC intracellular cholesterol transporter 2 homolog a-like [Nasonia vitripennis]XP_031784636.1 NPC intracellular cholesterol transporter 2 homolog a-like [Nasonia vitripennis]
MEQIRGNMKIITRFIICASLVVLSSQSTPVEKCKDSPTPKDVRIDGCTETPCSLVRGTTVTAEWDFSILEDTRALKPRVRATVLGMTVNYPFPQKDACSTLTNAKCPLEAGEDVTYQLSMPISKMYPKISLTIEFAFLDDKDNVVTCFAVPAKVTSK